MSTQTLTPDQPLLDDFTAKVEATEPNSLDVVSVEVVNSQPEMKNVEANGGESDQVEEKKSEDTDHEAEEKKNEGTDHEAEEKKDEDTDHEAVEKKDEGTVHEAEEKKDEETDHDAEEKKDEETDHEGEDEEGSDEEESESKKLEKENSPMTPASGSKKRPIRERKSVDRYTVSSPSKFPGYSATKPLSVEQGNGTQLKDIPNVAFKLSKRKPDDSLRSLHNILFGKKAKAHDLKKNIGLFSGYVWAENEEKQRTKIKEKIDKCVKDKLVDFCDILNVPISKTVLKKEEISAKLLEFLESPHATTDVLLAEKEKGKKRTKKRTPSKSTRVASEAPAKKQKKTSPAGKKRKQSSDVEEDNDVESSDAMDDSQEEGEDVSALRRESDNEESKSEEEEDQKKPHKHSSKNTVKEVQTTPVMKAAKSNKKTTKQSSSEKNSTDSTSASLSKSIRSKKQRTVKETQDSKGKVANKKQSDESPKDLVKDEGKGKGSKKAKAEPSREDLYAVAVDTLKKVDFNTATLSDILKLLGTHFGLDLMHRKAEVKDVITDVINNMSDEEDGEEAENDGDDDA